MPKIENLMPLFSDAEIFGDVQREVKRLISLDSEDHGVDTISWASKKNLDRLLSLEEGVFIVPRSVDLLARGKKIYIVVDNPRLGFLKLAAALESEEKVIGVHPSAIIGRRCRIAKSAFIGANVVIEDDCEIGDGTVILHNSVIMRRTRIGENVKIGCNCTIGGCGFGYEKDENGDYLLIPHAGNVIVEDDVEIGNNTAVDRAVLGSTMIRHNVKIDNLVHIAHGVDIGENSLVIANSMVAGSCVIGRGCWIAPSSSILNKKTVGDGATVGMGAVVLKDVEPGDVVAGVPAKSLSHRQ